MKYDARASALYLLAVTRSCSVLTPSRVSEILARICTYCIDKEIYHCGLPYLGERLPSDGKPLRYSLRSTMRFLCYLAHLFDNNLLGVVISVS